MKAAKAASAASEHSGGYAALLLPMGAIVLGSFIAILDNTVVNVAVPTLERAFSAKLDVLQWVITVYLLAQAAIIPLTGWLSDRYSAKSTYAAALALFTLGSLLCGLATGAGMLIVFRIVQGLGGGMLLPVGMALAFRMAPPSKRGQVMGAFGVPILLGPALGPVVAGWFVQYTDWRVTFLINVPICAVALLIVLSMLPAARSERVAGPPDLVGALLAPLAFGALSYGVSESTSSGWTGGTTLTGLSVGAVALAAFIVYELRAENPLLELRLFRRFQFTETIFTLWVSVAVLLGSLFLIPLFLEQVHGYGPFTTGLYILPSAVGAAICIPISGALFDLWGVKLPATVGLLLVAIGAGLLILVNPSTAGSFFIVPLILSGAGFGLALMPLNTHILTVAPGHLVNRVTSLVSALQSVAASLGIAGVATVLQARMTAHGASGGGSAGSSLSVGFRHASTLAYDDTFRVILILSIAAVLAAAALRRERAADA